MTSRELLDILNKVERYKASDVVSATKLIKDLCKKDIEGKVSSFNKDDTELTTCNHCKTTFNLTDIFGNVLKPKDSCISMYCIGCGKKLLINRDKVRVIGLNTGTVTTVNSYSGMTTPYDFKINLLEKILRDLDFSDAISYCNNSTIRNGSKVKIIKMIPKELKPLDYRSDTLCLVKVVQNKDELTNETNNPLLIVNVNELTW